MPDPQDIAAAQSKYVDSMVGAFEEQLRQIVIKAQSKMLAYLQQKLAITDGVIDQTPGNFQVLRSINDRFAEFLSAAGYDTLVNSFVSGFPGELQFLTQTIDSLASSFGIPLSIDWTAQDQNVFTSFALSAQDSITAALESVANSAMTRTMLTVGGLDFATLVETLATRIETSIGQAAGIADTSMMVFYRTATERAFAQIESDLPQKVIRYTYFGPDDSITRLFCQRLVESDKAYTRAEIDDMDNGQIPNVFLSCGGFRCRHQWGVEVPATS